MFVLNADITIGPYKGIKPNEVSWRSSVDDYTDTAEITLPAIAVLKKDGEMYVRVNTAQQLKEGMPVTIMAGYGSELRHAFSGYLSRIGYGTPLKLYCEGPTYLLRRKTIFAAYRSGTTTTQILNDLLMGTGHSLHPQTVSIATPAVSFGGVAGTEVLEWLKKNAQRVYWVDGRLYAGLEQLPRPELIRYRLNWNTIGDEGLSFGPLAKNEVNISFEKRNPDGSRKTANTNPGAVGNKVVKLSLDYTQADLEKLAATSKLLEEQKGFEGTLTTFLVPWCPLAATARITDGRYPERSGSYFVQQVSGSISTIGGRQVIKLGRRLV